MIVLSYKQNKDVRVVLIMITTQKLKQIFCEIFYHKIGLFAFERSKCFSLHYFIFIILIG